jgi:Zn-dependent M28 family amino/carboxypeptidase
MLALAGCSDSGALTVDGPGGLAVDGAMQDGSSNDGPRCQAPTAAPVWLGAYLADQIAKLSGVTDIAPGVRLTDRATSARRTTARTYLAGELSALGLAVSSDDYGQGANVVGELPVAGGGASDWIIVGAHFDTVVGSPGANDNATGVALVLAVARGLAAVPCRTRGVRFVMFDQEEIGLIGSTAYATRQQQARTPIVAVHTIDQVGWDDDNDLRFELELPTAQLLEEYRSGAAAVGAQVVVTTTSGTDHTAFRERGFAAVGLTEEYVGGDTTPHYHSPSDTASTVDAAYHAVATRLVTFVVARELGADGD